MNTVIKARSNCSFNHYSFTSQVHITEITESSIQAKLETQKNTTNLHAARKLNKVQQKTNPHAFAELARPIYFTKPHYSAHKHTR